MPDHEQNEPASTTEQTAPGSIHSHASHPAPPTVQGTVRAHSKPVWPVVVGVLSIVLGSLGTLGNLWGFASLFLVGLVTDLASSAGQDMPNPWTTEMLVAQGTYSVIALAVSIVLLVSGIGLVRRRRWSVNATRAWAVAKLPLTVVQAALAFWIQTQQFELMTEAMEQEQSGSGPPPGFFGAMGMVVGVITIAWTLLWGMAWPVFCLIWLARKPIKEQCSTWA